MPSRQKITRKLLPHEIYGLETNVVSANFTPQGGNVHLDATLDPYAFDGTWEITLTLKISENGLFGHGVGHGTGELHGMLIKFNTAPPEGPVDNPCADDDSAVLSGVIISP